MKKMRAVEVKKAGGEFRLVEKPVPPPGTGQILIKVETCGICHSDLFVKEGLFPGIEYPRVPGHEVIGRVVKGGHGATGWKEGERVGVGWHGGHCFRCEPCRKGDFINCQSPQVTGISSDGGYAEYMVSRQEALARVPDDLSSEEAAPLLCAGITTYNSLRNSGARGGDLVAVQGIGGLGHLGVQYASRLGFRVAAISGGADKEDLAKKLGASYYIDASANDPGEELAKRGGAKVILATAPSGGAMSGLVNGLSIDGTLIIVGVSEDPIEVTPLQLIMGRRSITGWPSGHGKDSEDTLNFSSQEDVRPMVEAFPLEKAEEAYAKMLENRVRFRAVLTL